MPEIVSGASLSRPVLLLSGIAVSLFAAALALWAYYGTTVFFEIVRAGWTACF